VTPLEELREAATLVRERAQAATPGPWVHVGHGTDGAFMGCGYVITDAEGCEGGDIAGPTGDLYPRGGYSPRDDMAWIASMHPGVGLALAAWLDELVRRAEAMDSERIGVFPDGTNHTLAIARTFLGRPA
jgi:hypothetical protein